MSINRRDKFKLNLNALYVPYYEALCAALPERWQPYSGYRSFDEQTRLWNQGRVSDGHIVTNAKAGESAHNWGCGTDWTIWDGDKPIWMAASDERWEEYVNAVVSVGLRPGIEFHDVDHNELKISCSWPAVLHVFDAQGSIAAHQKIESSITQ